MPADGRTAAPLRVALLLPASTGGIGRHVQMLAAALVERGHAVSVFGPGDTLDRLDVVASGAAAVPIPVGSTGSFVRDRQRLRRLLAGHDVVHAHGVRAGAQAAVAGARPLVVTWHNAPLGGRAHRGVHALLERISARRADVVLGASEDLVVRARAAGARRSMFCPVVAPLSPPPATAVPAGSAPVATVLAVARLHPQKRLDLLVRATAGWADRPDAPRVLVAGDGPLRAKLEQQAARLRSPLELLGHRDDVPALIRAATVIVLPSDWEARPLVAQEALRAGVPLVATAVGGVPGLVGPAAVLVPPGDAAALRRALDGLLSDPEQRRRLAAAGPKQAEGWPTERDMVTLIANVYLDLASTVSGQAPD